MNNTLVDVLIAAGEGSKLTREKSISLTFNTTYSWRFDDSHGAYGVIHSSKSSPYNAISISKSKNKEDSYSILVVIGQDFFEDTPRNEILEIEKSYQLYMNHLEEVLHFTPESEFFISQESISIPYFRENVKSEALCGIIKNLKSYSPNEFTNRSLRELS
jgi:hypothetical protein